MRLSKWGIGLGLVFTVLGVVALAEPMSSNTGGPVVSVREDGATYEETLGLTGTELADALGLKPLPVPRGEWIKSDDPRLGDCARERDPSATVGGTGSAATMNTEHGIYCLAGVAENAYQAWDIGTRLAGHVPCELDKQAFLLSQEAEAVDDEGDHVRATELWSKAHDLRVEAGKDCYSST
ncbi:MAG TPA: hypothetical protein VJN50_00955 [Actinomycetota bacterium]|nr:hypothetical protein [Actinomycetota bacterium]